MAEPGHPNAPTGQRPQKRLKAAAPIERGPDLQADALLKYHLKLPSGLTPGSVQANRVALRIHGDSCKAYVANAQHVYEVSLGSDLASPAVVTWSSGADKGKEGVLVPRSAQVGHIRQVEELSYLAAEIQGLYDNVHGGYHVLAAVDGVGNARLLASPLGAASAGATSEAEVADRAPGASTNGSTAAGEGHCCAMELAARNRGECGWTGLALRPVPATTSGSSGGDVDSGGSGGGGGPPELEVAVARQRMRDVSVFRDGLLLRTLHTMQGPTAIAYLPPGPYGGCGDACSGLLAVAEEHQVALWDIRQSEHGGCVQRLGVYGGGWPLYALAWVPGVSARQQGPGGGGEGLLAATGGERSVVMLEPRKWHVAAKWPGCVKYPATHMVRSRVAPGFVYVAGLDYECTAGRWDGSCGGSSGNANSGNGGHGNQGQQGHGRAMGPVQLLAAGRGEAGEREVAAGVMGDDGPDTNRRGGLSFRGDSKWLGLASVGLPPVTGAADGSMGCSRELVAALSLSGHLYVLAATTKACGGDSLS